MDLRLFGRVIWRFRIIVAVGLVLGLVLAYYAYSQSGKDEQWASYSTVLVTQRGFPEGRVAIPTETPPATSGTAQAGTFTPQFADPGRLRDLAVLYAQLAPSDPVRQIMARQGGGVDPNAPITALPIAGGAQGDVTLPLIGVTVEESTPARAVALNQHFLSAFQEFLGQQQKAAGIAPSQRVKLDIVNQPSASVPGQLKQLKGASLTRPLVLLLALLIASIGLAFILENLRPRSGGPVGRARSGGPGAVPATGEEVPAGMDQALAGAANGRGAPASVAGPAGSAPHPAGPGH